MNLIEIELKFKGSAEGLRINRLKIEDAEYNVRDINRNLFYSEEREAYILEDLQSNLNFKLTMNVILELEIDNSDSGEVVAYVDDIQAKWEDEDKFEFDIIRSHALIAAMFIL